MDPDGGALNIYYGAADCSIALARASLRQRQFISSRLLHKKAKE
jgi:predicted GH43/DUF377 family glycosyl hydrolase